MRRGPYIPSGRLPTRSPTVQCLIEESFLRTCELNGANPFDYLIELQRHADELKHQQTIPLQMRALRE